MEPTIDITVRAENGERIFHASVHTVESAIGELGRYERMVIRLKEEAGIDDTII